MTQITLTYNGNPFKTDATTIGALLHHHRINDSTKGIAVAQNETLIPRGQWHTTPIQDGDIIEVVKPFQGG